MFDGLTILGLIGAVKQLVTEATAKKQPAGSRIDWDKLEADDKAGVPAKERNRRMAKGYYHTTEPKKMFDLMAYRQDVLDGATPDELENNRKAGKYGAEKPVMTAYGKNYDRNGLPANVIVDVERYEWQRRNHSDFFEKRGLLKSYEYLVIEEKNWIYYSRPCWSKDKEI